MAHVDYFLKIEGIEGESYDSKHKGEIDLVSWSWSEQQQGTHGAGGGGGAGKVAIGEFHFATHESKASPKLMLACACGEHLKKATLVCRKAGKEQQEFLKIELSDVLVSSYKSGGNSHGTTVPTDQVTLNFAKIEYEYKEQKPDGSLGGAVKAGWDVKSNKKV
jgi:type VI secretion system secreted protein Hcp